MISKNLLTLRKLNNYTQEELAEKIGVSRQSIAKWEIGETLPDIQKCKALAELYGVTIDALLNYSEETNGLPIPPKGLHMFGIAKLSEKGQIVIPQQARKIFNLNPGDNLVVMGDEAQGLALIKEENMLEMFNTIKNLPKA